MTTNESDGQASGGLEDNGNGKQQRPISRFVHEHPGMAIAGGIALGVLVAALLPRRNRKFVTDKSSALADAVSSTGLMLYREALERAEKAGSGLRGFAGQLGQARNADDGNEAGAPSGSGIGETISGLLRHFRGRSRD